MNNPITLFAGNPQDSEEVRLEKSVAFLVAGSCSVAGLLWCVMYYLIFGWSFISFLPLLFVIFVGAALLLSHITKNHYYTIYAQIVCIIYIPTLLQWNIGGVFDSGLVIVWSFVGPMCALMFFSIKGSIPWFILFLVNLVVTFVFDDIFSLQRYAVASGTRTFFFIMNLGFASAVVFIFASYYVNAAVREQKKATSLLSANLQQEMILRENEKLATLGKLSAGVAHELNNPSATIQRGSQQIQQSISKLISWRLGQDRLDKLQPYLLYDNWQPLVIDPVKRIDRESELETTLTKYGLQNTWALAPALVAGGFLVKDFDQLRQNFSQTQLPVVIDLISITYTIFTLLREMKGSAVKIEEIVNAMRSYTFLDQADYKKIDIHEGLDSTLLMLKGQLNDNITVSKNYDNQLPLLEVYVSELNQVWTSIIDNAIYALGNKGKLTIKTYKEQYWAVVEICDNGPGIAQELQARIFDPFFTTKPVGQGSGLGLNVSHNIIAKKHKGTISVDSHPGRTCFTVKLPLDNSKLTAST